MEVQVNGPGDANRMFMFTGLVRLAAPLSSYEGHVARDSARFLVGPVFEAGGVKKAIATAAISSDTVSYPSGGGGASLAIEEVEADWDDESGRVQVRVTLSCAGYMYTVRAFSFQTAVLAAVAD